MLTFSNFSYPFISNNLSGISEAMQKLPDNTQNLIDPQDLRDAIYTTWVNNIFKQTTASDSYYIGLDSDSANNILTNPFYFGKRNYLGSNVMNPTLLNNGTDIFFFNNKPDSVTQSTIVTFLAGNPSLFNKAPYIITSATNSGLDISVINPNGNVNLMAASNSSIYLNGYKFPSIISTGSVGQALILGSNNILSWQNVSNNFAYSNPNISTIAVGGVPSGISFSNISVTDLFNQMFYPNIAPIMSVFTITYMGVSGTKAPGNFYTRTSNGSGGLGIEVGSLIGSITFSVTIQPKSSPVTYATFSGSGTDGGKIQLALPTIGSSPLVVSGTVSPIPNPNNTTYTYNVYVKDSLGAQSNTLSTNIQSYYPYYYYRVYSSNPNSSPYTYNDISNWIQAGGTVSKVVSNTENSTTNNVSGFSSPNQEFLYLAIPNNKTGKFTNLDNPNFDSSNMLDFFNVFTASITTNFWSNITYYIYISKSAKTNTNPSGYSFS